MLTWVSISASALAHNIGAIRRLIGKNILLMPVVKSNAYGHGLVSVAKLCDKDPNVNCLCVVNLEEALTLKDHGVVKPIIILSFYELDRKKITTAVKQGITFPVYTLEQAKFLNRIGRTVGTPALVHLKVDTGTSRIGILPSELSLFIKKIKKYPYIHIDGLFSHFSSSEEDPQVTREQQNILVSTLKIFKEEGVEPRLLHSACTAAAILAPFSHGNAVRLGIGLYGLQPSTATRKKIPLKPALSWYTTIIQVKHIPSGTAIGYGRTYITKRATKLAILPVGYSDGFDRRLSNNGYVLIQGTRCPIRGRICMNLTMVDVTHLQKVKVGERVTLIGKDKQNRVAADDLARWCGTVHYEIVDRINPLLPRVLT